MCLIATADSPLLKVLWGNPELQLSWIFIHQFVFCSRRTTKQTSEVLVGLFWKEQLFFVQTDVVERLLRVAFESKFGSTTYVIFILLVCSIGLGVEMQKWNNNKHINWVDNEG